MQLFTFANEAGLEAQGGNDFLETDASGPPVQGVPGNPGFGTIQQGYVKSSNVNVLQEMTNLIQIQSAYTAAAKMITATQTLFKDLLAAFPNG